MPACGEVAHLVPEPPAGLQVHADRGLIQEHQIRIATEREAKQHPLPLPAGQLAEPAVLDALEAGAADDLGRGQRLRVVAAEERDVLAHEQRLRHARNLQHRADPGTCVRGARIPSQHARAPFIR